MPTRLESLTPLRQYLDRSGFANLYRFVVSAQNFYYSPNAINARSQASVAATDTYVDGELRGRRLLWTLMADVPVVRADLSADEAALVEKLIADGFLHTRDDRVHNGDYQLICVDNLYLFVDAGLGFPARRAAEVYFGADSALLLYHLNGVRPERWSDDKNLPTSNELYRVLDLGTGSGVIGLSTAARAGRALLVDISGPALRLARINRTLNDLDSAVEIRAQDMRETLAEDRTWDLITCNPPFIAVPPEFALPEFAHGPGPDGLDLMRSLIDVLPSRLAAHGDGFLVADLLGDHYQPFFLRELDALAREWCVEVYIEQRRPAEGHAESMAQGIVRAAERASGARLSVAETTARLRAFVLDELSAEQIYLTIIRIRRGIAGLVLYNRWRAVSAATPPRGA